MTVLVSAGRVFAPEGTIVGGAVMIEDGRLTAVGPRAAMTAPAGAREQDWGEAALAPGLVDIHVHGGAGLDFMSADAAGVHAVARHLARHGVTSFCATTVTAAWSEVLAAVERLALAGCDIHLEGPFLSRERRGVHPEAELLAPTLERLEALWERSRGRLRIITLAPELDGALEFIAAARARGITVALGHSDASAAQTLAAVQAGATHVTHAFNAMRPLHQREPGLLGVALTEPGLTVDVIADGHHVDPRLVAMLWRLAARQRTVLISDAISATGCPEGEYALGGITVAVAGGRCLAGGRLAGSVLTLDRAVGNFMNFTGCDLATAWNLASGNPARAAGLNQKGQLCAGADADLVVLSQAGAVQAVYVAGQQLD
ncbi:MAG: N-acetylglucosamine-6-phosphate deacetylase [Terriglobales bacterium]